MGSGLPLKYIMPRSMLINRCVMLAWDTGSCRGGIAAPISGSASATSRGLVGSMVCNRSEICGVMHSELLLFSRDGCNLDRILGWDAT